MSGFADEGIEYDDEDMNSGYLQENNMMNNAPFIMMANGVANNGNGNGFGIPPDVVMGEESGEFEYGMDVQEALQGGRSAGNLDDDFELRQGFSRSLLPREAEPQRTMPTELEFTVDTPAMVGQ